MVSVAQLAEHRIVAPVVVGSNPITHPKNNEFAPVAQLDRASDFESAGRAFESPRACQASFGPLAQLVEQRTLNP